MTRRIAIALLAFPLLFLACSPGGEDGGETAGEQERWEGYGSQTVVLFFAEGSLDLVWREELRAIELQADVSDRAARTLEELFRGPEEGLGRAFPPGAQLDHVFLEERDGLLTLDFNPVTAQLLVRAGSLEERVALEALLRTLRVNFPAVRSLRILVGGQEAESFGGHLSIARPLVLSEGRP